MAIPLRVTLAALSIMALSAADGQAGPNNPNNPNAPNVSVGRISPMQPDFTMRPLRSFRDPSPGGSPGGTAQPNRDFNDLYFRFVGAVSEYDRQTTVDHLVRVPHRQATDRRHVRRAARHLAAGSSKPAIRAQAKPAAD